MVADHCRLHMDLNAIDWPRTALAGIAVAALVFAVLRFIGLKVGRRVASDAWKQDPAHFGEQQYRLGIEGELNELRAEVASLRAEVAQLKITRGAAPQYEEAMALAGRGSDAQSIAQRCSISVAEAELLRALSQRPPE